MFKNQVSNGCYVQPVPLVVPVGQHFGIAAPFGVHPGLEQTASGIVPIMIPVLIGALHFLEPPGGAVCEYGAVFPVNKFIGSNVVPAARGLIAPTVLRVFHGSVGSVPVATQ